MYYLQSRYYNPEWGRFINTDALAGQVGELLGHNLFAYCKNNPVNRQDPGGFLSFSASDGFGDCDNPLATLSYHNESNPNLSWSPSGATAVAVSATLKAAEDHLDEILDHVVVGTRMITTRYTGTMTLPATLATETLGKAGKVVGVVGIFLTVNSMRDDLYNNKYTSTQKWLRFGLDAGGFLVAAAFFSAGGGAALAGTFATAIVVETFKYIVDKKFGEN